MEKFEYTQCSLNLANADAIVYRFANGEVSEITAEDFDGNENRSGNGSDCLINITSMSAI